MRSPGTWGGGSEDSGSEGSTPQDQSHIQTRMASESSEDDSDIPNMRGKVSSLASRQYGGGLPGTNFERCRICG